MAGGGNGNVRWASNKNNLTFTALFGGSGIKALFITPGHRCLFSSVVSAVNGYPKRFTIAACLCEFTNSHKH